MRDLNKAPAILALAGLDPGGGAGLTADIQTISAYRAHPLAVATAITAQSVDTVERVVAVDADMVTAQVAAALRDWTVIAVKVGLIPNLAILASIAGVLDGLRVRHLVIDPVFYASTGDALSHPGIVTDFLDLMLPFKPILTPNKQELAQLSGALSGLHSGTLSGTSAQAAAQLVARGARAVLVTDGEGQTTQCTHQLVTCDMQVLTIHQPRLKGRYHGSGCTLSAALAGELATGKDLPEAVQGALDFTHRSLQSAFGSGSSRIPDRKIPL